MPSFLLLGAAATAAVVTHAALRRGRTFAVVSGVFTGVHTLAASAVASAIPAGPLFWAFCAANATSYAHFLLLARPTMRPSWYRALISLPAHYVTASSMLALPFAAAHALGAPAYVLAVPYVVGLFGLLDSLRAPREVYELELDQSDAGPLRRQRFRRAKDTGSSASEPRPLRVVQITDPHLGPFMSVARLRSIAERAAKLEPDLVLLTGDFLTMESHGSPDALAEALAPLKPLAGRTFACMGNHDHEAPRTVLDGLTSAGVQLLIDELAVATTPAGRVEVLGLDFRFRDRAEHLREVSSRHPRTSLPRVALLHDPGAFVHLPESSADLVFSGHTHGGQVGLLRFGLPYTAVSALSKVPDHGLWARGRDRLYVHRGTGQYGFPLRVGVPAEESLLLVRGLAGA